ncbi:hypothetical protein L917_13638 [Phytophthora nicotianae]|uniref:Uncharacterized protein n=1 Tax=Phytophthora nicotianae TaxID=4792 RepID=W2KPB0_PHYNI|nr:hypothetical protein L917_13638 [Phytophthora nicotianae]
MLQLRQILFLHGAMESMLKPKHVVLVPGDAWRSDNPLIFHSSSKIGSVLGNRSHGVRPAWNCVNSATSLNSTLHCHISSKCDSISENFLGIRLVKPSQSTRRPA